MSIQLNPLAQAEMEVGELIHRLAGGALRADRPAFGITFPQDHPDMLKGEIMGILSRAIMAEKLMLGQHEQCGADNPEGTVAKCKCSCHKGHYRHFWTPIIKTPQQLPDGTYQLLDRCKYCPDIRMKIIKPAWVNEKHTLVSLEYLIRGEQRVLTKEEWLERAPKAQDMKLIREAEL